MNRPGPLQRIGSSQSRRRAAQGGRWAEKLGTLASGIVAAFLVGLTLLVAVVLAMGERSLSSGQVARVTATATATPTPTWTPLPIPVLDTLTPSPTPSPLPTMTGAVTPSVTPTPSATRQPSPTSPARCVPPSNWRRYTVQRGETLQECLRREILEELGIEIEVGALLTAVRHAYTHFRITLHAFDARILGGEPRCIECAAWRWIRLEEADGLAFSAADLKVLAALEERQAQG